MTGPSIQVGDGDLAKAAALIAGTLERPQAPLPSAGEFPDPVVEASPAPAVTPITPEQVKAARAVYTADRVHVFCRVREVRIRSGLVEIAPVTRLRAKGGGLIWLMIPRSVLERCRYFVPGQVSKQPAEYPLVKGSGLMICLSKNRLVLDMRRATPEEAKAEPSSAGGGYA